MQTGPAAGRSEDFPGSFLLIPLHSQTPWLQAVLCGGERTSRGPAEQPQGVGFCSAPSVQITGGPCRRLHCSLEWKAAALRHSRPQHPPVCSLGLMPLDSSVFPLQGSFLFASSESYSSEPLLCCLSPFFCSAGGFSVVGIQPCQNKRGYLKAVRKVKTLTGPWGQMR